MDPKTILAASSQYLQNIQKLASKEKINRGKLGKRLQKAKDDYSKLKKALDILEANDAKTQQELGDHRSRAQQSRKNIMKMHKAMQTMDLANANDAVFYADDDDVGYIINGKENHISINDNGDFQFTPMHQYRKSKRAPKIDDDTETSASDEACVDDTCTDEAHNHPAKEEEQKEEDTDDVNDTADKFEDLYSSLFSS